MRYASNSFGNLDNSDRENTVYGAQDEYLFVDLKTTFKISRHGQIALGVDNLFNNEAFVAHPWPQRSFFLEGKLTF